jgi:hypothetical protein
MHHPCGWQSSILSENLSTRRNLELGRNVHWMDGALQGRIQVFKLRGGAHLKELRRAEGGAKIVGVFRVKNHGFMPKNLIFFQF